MSSTPRVRRTRKDAVLLPWHRSSRRSSHLLLRPLSLLVGYPRSTHAVSDRRDVVLLDVFAVLPRLAPPVGEDHVDLARVVGPMRRGVRDDLAKRPDVAPVDRFCLVEIGGQLDRPEPSHRDAFEPRKHLCEVVLRRLDPFP